MRALICILYLVVSVSLIGQECYDPCKTLTDQIRGKQYGIKTYDEMLLINDSIISLTSECPDCVYFSHRFWEWAAHQFRHAKNHADQFKSLEKLNAVNSKIDWEGDSILVLEKHCSLQARYGHYYMGINDFQTARKCYINIIDTIKQSHKYSEQLNTLKNICYQRQSDISTLIGNFNEAETNLTYAIEDEIEYANIKNRKPVVWSIYSKRGHTKYLNGNYKDAFEDHLITFEYIDNYLDTISTVVLSTRSLTPIFQRLIYVGKTALKLNKIVFVDKIFQHLESLPIKPTNPLWLTFDLLKMEKSLSENKMATAKIIGSTILQSLDTLPKEVKLKIETLTLLGNCHELDGENEKALKFYDLALDIIATEKSTNSYNNEYLQLNKYKIDIALSENNEDLIAASIIKLLSFIDERLAQDLYQSDHFSTLDQILPILETGLENRLIENDLSLVFDIIEFVKSRKLESRFIHSSNLSKSNKSFVSTYKANSKTLQNLKVNRVLGDSTLELRNRIFELNEICKNLKAKIDKKNSIQHYRTSLTDTEAYFGKDDIYISGFAGERSYYILHVKKDNSTLKKIPIDELSKLVRDLYKELSAPTSLKRTKSISQKLHQYIIGAPIKNKNLLFALDDNLLSLPMESLFDGEAYLVENNNVRYTPSAAMEQNWKSVKIDRIAAFKPSQTASGINLVSVENEIEGIKNYLDAEIYENEKATINSFTSAIPGYQIIHLATHADSETIRYDKAYVQMSADQNQDGKLYYDQFSTLSINTELISLGACNTAVGKSVKAEGVQSLSSQLLANGSQSVLSTLWSINDRSSSSIINNFYKNLSNGDSKSVAISAAKRLYLSSAIDLEKHPHYWAGIILTGSESPLSFKRNLTTYVIYGLLVFLGLFLIGKYILWK